MSDKHIIRVSLTYVGQLYDKLYDLYLGQPTFSLERRFCSIIGI